MKTASLNLCLAVVLTGAISTLVAQTTPAATSADNAPATSTAAAPATSAPDLNLNGAGAPIANAAAPARAARPRTPQAVGGIQADSTKTSGKFYFGSGEVPAGFTKVTSDMAYSEDRGYGFDPNTTVNLVTDAAGGKAPASAITNDKQFFFSVALPEGNYRVTVTLGHPSVATNQFVKSEVHRLQLENVATKPGEFVTKTFIVNEHQPVYANGGRVTLINGRESQQEAADWDKGITLEFSGVHPSVNKIEIEKADVPTIYLIGDSTSCDQVADPYSSWGGMVTNFLKPDVAFCNLGESGQTLASTLGAHRFDKVWSQMKPGEYLFVQFGHNDMKSTAANALETFKTNLHRVATETRSHQGILVLVTPVSRANPQSGFKGYVEAMKEVADQDKIPLIDLNASSQVLYQAYGGGEISHKLLFAYDATGKLDPTHHNRLGSYEIAKTVLAGLQQTKLDLVNHIVDGFQFDPAKPDKPETFHVPPSTNLASDKPPGS